MQNAPDGTYAPTTITTSVADQRGRGALIGERRPKALLVDDDRAVLRMIRAALQRVGIECVTASSGRRAIELAPDPTIDLLLVDLRLGDMDGISLLRELHNAGCGHHFAIITGYGTVGSAVQAMKMGALDVIEKPFTAEEIAAKTQLLLRTTAVVGSGSGAASHVPLIPRSAAERWALLVYKALASDRDPSTLEIWARVVGLSYTSLRQACCLVAVQATTARDFVRMLRAVRNCCAPGGQSLDASLNVHDTRTLRKLLIRSGLGSGNVPSSVEDFLRRQRFISPSNQGLRTLVKLLIPEKPEGCDLPES